MCSFLPVSIFDQMVNMNVQYWTAATEDSPSRLSNVLVRQLASSWRNFSTFYENKKSRNTAKKTTRYQHNICSICLDEESPHCAPNIRVSCCDTPFHIHCLGKGAAERVWLICSDTLQ